MTNLLTPNFPVNCNQPDVAPNGDKQDTSVGKLAGVRKEISQIKIDSVAVEE